MINGVAIISACMFVGFLVGGIIGQLTGVGSNVGGVGFAMLMLLLITDRMKKKGKLSEEVSGGIKFWQSLYIPVVIAMTATQNVVQAAGSGSFAIICGIIVVAVGFMLVRVSSLLSGEKSSSGKRELSHRV